MKKKIIIASLLLICMLLSSTSVNASTISYDEAKKVINALGIMQGYENGSFGDYDTVTRSQLAKILTASSKYKNLVPESSTTSPFSDVKYDNWAAGYVSTCVKAGYLTGCDDGTYKPDNYVKYEEVLCGILRVLEYEDSDIQNNYPYGVIALAKELHISDNVGTAIAGKAINRREVAMLIYNALSAKMKNGNQKLINTLGYDQIDGVISANEIVYQDSIGPIIISNSNLMQDYNINLSTAKIYKDGIQVSASSIKSYDVIYYSKNLNTVWVYDDKVIGIYQSATPNKENPSSVIISGREYNIGGSAKSDFSYSGYSYGSAVAGILDRDGNIIGVQNGTDEKISNKGIVTASGIKTFTNSNGSDYSSYYVTIINFTGNEYTYEIKKDLQSYIGRAVEISFGDDVEITSLNKSGSVYGKINASKLTIGKEFFVSNPVIIEYNSYSNKVELKTIDRFDGYNISSSDVLYYVANGKNEIECLVVSDLTYDSYTAGYIARKANGENRTYIAYIGSKTYQLSGDDYSTGAALFNLDGGSIDGARSILSFAISNIIKVEETFVENKNGTRYSLAEDAVIYRVSNGSVMQISKDEIKDGEMITAYLDNSVNSNGRVRVIVVY